MAKNTWVRKPNQLAYFYLTVKKDGVRFRPIGSYASVPHKRLLSYVATSIDQLVKFSGAKTFNYTNALDFKASIKNFNDTANTKHMKINRCTFDVKDFFTEIQKIEILKRFDFFKEL